MIGFVHLLRWTKIQDHDWPGLSHTSTPAARGQVGIMLDSTSESQRWVPFPKEQTKTVDIHFISFMLFFNWFLGPICFLSRLCTTRALIMEGKNRNILQHRKSNLIFVLASLKGLDYWHKGKTGIICRYLLMFILLTVLCTL